MIQEKVTPEAMEGKGLKSRHGNGDEKRINKDKCNRKIIGWATYTISRRSFYCPKGQKYNKSLDQRPPVAAKFSFEIKKALLLLGQRIPLEESR